MRNLVLYNLLLIMIAGVISCTPNYYVSGISFKNNIVDENLSGNDPLIESLYRPYKIDMEKEMKEVIGFTDVELKKSKPESLLTNFLADMYLSEAKKYISQKGLGINVDISFSNYGGIRTFIPKGEITVGKIYELMPFENEMVFLKITGKDMKIFLDILAENGGDCVAGVIFKIKDNKAEEIMISGKPIDYLSDYWLMTNDYVANGGDNFEILKKSKEVISSGELLRDLILDKFMEMKNNGEKIEPKLDGRIYYE